jgi:hypothetical protein
MTAVARLGGLGTCPWAKREWLADYFLTSLVLPSPGLFAR